MNAVNPETNGLLHTKLKPATTKVLVHSFLTELGESCERDASRLVNAVFLVDGSHSLQDACHRHGSDFRCEKHGNRNAFERIFGEIKRRTIAFSSCFSNTGTETADDWLRSFSFAGISVPEHYRRNSHRYYGFYGCIHRSTLLGLQA